MRRLNQKEKDLCRLMLDFKLTDNLIFEILTRRIPEHPIVVDRVDKSVALMHHWQNPLTTEIIVDPRSQRLKEDTKLFRAATEEIVTLLKLLTLLETEGLIYTFENSKSSEKRIQVSGDEDASQFHGVVLFTGNSAEQLSEYSQRGVVITEDFNDFIENKFVTREDLLKLKQSELSLRANIISAGALVITLFSTIFTAISTFNIVGESKEPKHIIVIGSSPNIKVAARPAQLPIEKKSISKRSTTPPDTSKHTKGVVRN